MALLTRAAELRAESRWDEAEPPLREALRLVRNRFGPEHFETHGCVAHLAHVQHARGHLPEAEKLLRQAIPSFHTSYICSLTLRSSTFIVSRAATTCQRRRGLP